MDRTALKLLPIIMMLLLSSFAAVSISESSDASSVSTVSLDVNGGTGTAQEWTVETGTTIELPTKLFTRSGYYLSGWNTEADGSGTNYDVDLKVNGDIVLYAQWKSLPIDGSLSIQDTEAPTETTGTYSYMPIQNGQVVVDDDQDKWLVFIDTVFNGYGWGVDEKPDWLNVSYEGRTLTFSGTPTGAGVWPVIVRMDSAGSSAYIWWTITVPSESDSTGTVTFDLDGGEGRVPSLTGCIGTVVTLPGEGSVSKDGFTLAGWDIRVTEGVGTFALNSFFTLDGNYTATAHWLPEANVVILDGSGQIGNQIEAFVGYNQQTITLPSEGYSKEGSTFAGWRLTSAPDEVFALGYIYTIEGPTYMTAYYIPDESDTATVTFDSNGGVGTLSQTVESGMYVVLPESGFSNDTDLEGWISSTDGETYSPSDRVAISEDTTFSAVWGTEMPDVVTVSFDLNGGSGSVATQVLDYGDVAVRPSDPTRSASIFNCWMEVGGGEWDFDDPVTHSMTLRADWITHFTRSYEGNTVVISLSETYRGSSTTVDWGDGTTSTGTLSFTHDYGEESSGTITVTTHYGMAGQTVSSSVQYSVSGGSGTEPEPVPIPDEDGIPIWIIPVVIAAVLIITVLVVRS